MGRSSRIKASILVTTRVTVLGWNVCWCLLLRSAGEQDEEVSSTRRAARAGREGRTAMDTSEQGSLDVAAERDLAAAVGHDVRSGGRCK